MIEDPKKRGILIVDDEEFFTDCVRMALTTRGYETILIADCGTAALNALSSRGHEIYAVLLDLLMPDINGLEVMARLAQSHRFPVGVIAVTADGRLESEMRFMGHGSENVIPAMYCRKPLSLSSLCSRIERVLEQIHDRRMGASRAGGARAES